MATKRQLEALKLLAEAVLEMVKISNGTSSGHIYARMQTVLGAKYHLDLHNGVVAGLERSGKITNNSYWLEVVETGE